MADDIHAARYTVLKAIGSDVSYEELLGVSGMAFRLQVTEELCPSSANSFRGFRCCVRSLELMPFSIRFLEFDQEDANAFKNARDAVIESINRGIPVHYGNCVDGVIIGYLNDGQKWLCLHPMKGPKVPFLQDELLGALILSGEPRAEIPEKKQLASDALSQAVEMAGIKMVEEYTVGFYAWEVWLGVLEKLRKQTNSIDPEIMLGNAGIYFSLIESRRAAANYLHSIADSIGQESTEHLIIAARLYEQLVEALLANDKDSQQVAPFPEPPSGGVKWKHEQMLEQIRRLTIAYEIEKKAIAEIGEAITT
ncbi:MAG: hypothetical protein JW715_11025 [Sedimentisphaerales bacterium]|nr:hypothetical protein [Sedimentisphaerales bacterium]